MYSAIILDEKSHDKLVNWVNEKFTVVKREDWDIVAHHMTIKMGELPTYLTEDIGTSQTLEVTGYGSTDKVVAVRVAGYYTNNKVPHITIAVNRAVGGKPVMSNDIKKWYPIIKGFKVSGIVEEVE